MYMKMRMYVDMRKAGMLMWRPKADVKTSLLVSIYSFISILIRVRVFHWTPPIAFIRLHWEASFCLPQLLVQLHMNTPGFYNSIKVLMLYSKPFTHWLTCLFGLLFSDSISSFKPHAYAPLCSAGVLALL